MSDEQQIRALVQTWMDATQKGDIDAVLDLMTDDVVFLIAGRPPMVGKDAYAQAAKGQSGAPRPKFEGNSEIRELKVLGEWAYLWSKLSVIATPPGGKPSARAGYTLTILRKEQGKWRLARDANLLT